MNYPSDDDSYRIMRLIKKILDEKYITDETKLDMIRELIK